MLNPDGVIAGNHRCNLAGLDLNRAWATPTEDVSPTILHTKNLIRLMQQEGRNVILFCDLHGHRYAYWSIWDCRSLLHPTALMPCLRFNQMKTQAESTS